MPAEKHVGDIAYSGSIVQKGEMNALCGVHRDEDILWKDCKTC